MAEAEALKARRNKVSKMIPVMKKNGEDVDGLMAEMKEASERIKAFDSQLRKLDEEINTTLLAIPNRPDASVPEGGSDEDNLFVRDFMKPTEFGFEPKPHWELGAELGILDPEMAARVSGARFMYYIGAGARLERAVINFMLNTHE